MSEYARHLLALWRHLRAQARTLPRRLLFGAHPLRALEEVALLQVPVLIWVLTLMPHQPVREQVQMALRLMVPVSAMCILWVAARTWHIRWRVALLVALAQGAALAVTPTALLTTVWASRPRTLHFPALSTEGFAILWFLAFTAAFLVSRLGVYLLQRWNRLRRTHFIWSLTHAHLMVVVLAAVLLATASVVTNLVSFNERLVQQWPTLLITSLPIFFFLFIITVLLLLVLLPPSALFSYLFARHTTSRLQALTAATTTLRAGHYDVRVRVRGEDEVAQLQANFNAMATELERAVAEVQAERDRVAALLRNRRELVASVSHELRTPVATLRGYLDSALTHWAETPPPSLQADLEVMQRETLRLQALIDDLFALSRAEVGMLDLRCTEVEAGALAERCTRAVAPLAWQSGRVSVAAEQPAQPLYALADSARLEQVLGNLLQNAVRHTAPGGIVVLHVAAEEQHVRLEVRDTGEGIAPEEVPHLFERFYRTASARAASSSGTGLGLALVKEYTEAMGGTVSVRSVLGEGSCFAVRLPRSSAPPASALPEERAPEASRAAV